MNFLLTSDFKTVAAEIAALVFPKTQFQVLFKEIGTGNVAITFNNPKDFSDNFRIQFYSKPRTLIISAYSRQGIVYLNYIPENKYDWCNGSGFTITKPPNIGDKFEFLARKFSLLLPEFFLGENKVKFSIFTEFETTVTKVAFRTFPQFHFSLNYRKNRETLCLNFIGYRNLEIETFQIEPEIFAQKESIFFNVDFRPIAKCLAINTRWLGERYLLVYNSIGDLSWSTLQSDRINTPSAFGKEFETIAIQLYPLLQEFFPE